MYCEHCQNEYPEGRKFCPQCGTLIKAQVLTTDDDRTRACPSCGKLIPSDRRFCIYCGYKISSTFRSCPVCDALAPAEALFCGDCGAPLAGPPDASASQPPERVPSALQQPPAAPAPTSQAAAAITSPFNAQSREEQEADPEQSRRPGLRTVLFLSLLLGVAFAAYRLSSFSPSKDIGGTPQQADKTSNTALEDNRVVEEPQKNSLTPLRDRDPSDPGERKSREEPGKPVLAPPPVTTPGLPLAKPLKEVPEKPLPAPRFYQVTTLTELRDKPTWASKKVTDLQPGMLIQVVAIAGDWLKVKSKSTPPKPPGYVWREDAKPE